MAGPRVLKKNDYLFREGDASEAMYVIKAGKLAVLKSKGNSEITLAELGPGDMIGEMAFFDSKPRSASARALIDTTIIELPFKSLNAQFKTFPEWAKAIMRTVNNHLRSANLKIKSLEKSDEETNAVFPPHTVTRLCSILANVTKVYGEKGADGTLVPPGTLRKHTIQIFQQPTNKMTTMTEVLQGLGHMKIEDLGEGKQRLTVFKPDFLVSFVDFYNDFLFKSEDKRTSIEEKEMKTVSALLFYGRKAIAAGAAKNEKGELKINLTQMQNDSMRDLGALFSVDDVNSLIEKKLVGDKFSLDGALAVTFAFDDLQAQYPYWELIHACRKVTRT
jgi:CRP/FNR family cyclic AMP-dependent transcriptional regulator